MNVLWVDLRLDRREPAAPSFDAVNCRAVTSVAKIETEVGSGRPDAIVFEYDYPDTARLVSLQMVKRRFARVPVLMYTKTHSEQLAIWAQRNRVWGYFICPSDLPRLKQALSVLSRHLSLGRTPRTVWGAEIAYAPPAMQVPPHLRLAPALHQIQNHFATDIRVHSLATLCGLKESVFRREFGKQYGVSPRDYIVQFRLEQAKHRLADSSLSVGDVASSVGMNDTAGFCRQFKRRYGCTPTLYRQRCGKETRAIRADG
jgi:AraC-like DNA-binding protein